MKRDFPEAIVLLDDKLLSASSVAYRCLHSATLSSKKKEKGLRTQLGELEGQFRENRELQQRVDSLRSKLFTLQTDRDPNTPVSKLQEQVTRNS